MSKPKVSVCLPVYNGAAFIGEAIESILAQTYKDFELILSDDGSTDNSAEILHAYAAKDSRVKVFIQPRNLGLFGNWQFCIDQAVGEYIKPFAQDDFCRAKFFEALVAALDNNPTVSLAGSSREYFDGQKAFLTEPNARKFYRDQIFKGAEVILKFLRDFDNLVGFPPAVMFRKRDVGSGFDTRYYHCGDVEYFCRLLTKGDYFFVARPLVTYRYHGNNQTVKNYREYTYISDLLLMQETYAGFMADHGITAAEFEGLIADNIAVQIEVGATVLEIDYNVLSKVVPPHLVPRGMELVHLLTRRNRNLHDEIRKREDAVEYHRKESMVLFSERDILRQENEQLRQVIEGMQNSATWQMTKPIRSVLAKMGKA